MKARQNAKTQNTMFDEQGTLAGVPQSSPRAALPQGPADSPHAAGRQDRTPFTGAPPARLTYGTPPAAGRRTGVFSHAIQKEITP